MSHKIELLDNKKLVRQLVGLERRTARGGRDSIDHAPACHDDLANAVAGALAQRGRPTHGFTEFCDAVMAAGGVDQYFAKREKERDRGVTAVNPKTGQRIRLVDHRWVDCTTGAPI